MKVARPRLERIEADILNNFKVLGAQAHPLNGVERLEIIYHVFNQDRIEPFRFNYKMLPETGLKTKDFIAPASFNFEALGLNPPPLGGQALAVFSSSRGRDKIQH